MLQKPIIDRLKSQIAAFSNRVAGGAEFEAAIETEADALAAPCAFVIRLGDAVDDSTTANKVVQRIEEQFGVIVCVSATADERGQDADAQVHAIRQSLWDALLGWTDDAAINEGMEYRGFRLLAADRARAWYQFDFSTATVIDNL